MEHQIQTAIEAASESAILAFGPRAQMIKTCEELSELMAQLCKRLNEQTVENEGIIDEVADVLFMVNQMRIVFGKEEVDKRIIFKLNRLMESIRTRTDK